MIHNTFGLGLTQFFTELLLNHQWHLLHMKYTYKIKIDHIWMTQNTIDEWFVYTQTSNYSK